MNRILNLTQHRPTPEQLADGVTCGDINGDAQLREIASLLTFDTLPTPVEVRHRAERLAEIASKTTTLVDYGGETGLCVNERFKFAMIGGEPYLMAPLEAALRAHGITPLYAFSVRESVDQVQPDGHAGFVGCEADEPDTVEVLTESDAARYRVLPASAMTATKAKSVTALFEELQASDDAYNLELTADGFVGRFQIEDYRKLGHTAEIVAIFRDGVVYQY